MEIISKQLKECFIDRAGENLRRYYPEKLGKLSQDEMRAFVIESQSNAKRYGLTTEQAVMCFAHIKTLLGDQFEFSIEWDWVSRILRSTYYDQNTRASSALDLVREKLGNTYA